MAEIRLIDKLRAFTALSRESESAVEEMGSRRVRAIAAGDDIISEGDDPKNIHLLLDGWACRYKTLEDGRRQILAFFMPGDLADLHVYILSEMDHSIGALTPVRFASITPTEFENVSEGHPRLLRALWWESLLTASIQREWLVTVGQRSALEAVAHLCLELFLRSRLVNLCGGNDCPFPITQSDIADALGLTQPHVSRTLRELALMDLITLRRRVLTVHDLRALKRLAGFNPNYLHHAYEAVVSK